MPYIKKEDRTRYKKVIEDIEKIDIYTVGELNYLITSICDIYLNQVDESYKAHNDIIGVLNCVEEEWYRRKVVPYEDKKLKENGDVYV